MEEIPVEHKELIEFRYDTQLLLDVYGLDDDQCDDLVDEIRDHIIVLQNARRDL